MLFAAMADHPARVIALIALGAGLMTLFLTWLDKRNGRR